jgi:superfamily II DNA or RNA helicase
VAKIVQAAEILGFTATYVRRIRHKIGFYCETPSIMFDRKTVEAYKLRP